MSKRITALLLTLALAMSCLSGCSLPQVGGQEAEASVTPAEQDAAEAITKAAEEILSEHSQEDGKEETVFVLSDANGKVNKTIVSNWLKNKDGAESLPDQTELKDLENVKGDGTYTQGADGTITWEARGADVYYQGTSSKAPPLDIHITYTLDGKEVTPEQLAGASGHLNIHVEYENLAKKQVKINGKSVELCQPFTVITGTVLDNTKVSGGSVDNGEVINTGEKTVAVGMLMPGLKESLGLSDLKNMKDEPVDVNIPEDLDIEADVKRRAYQKYLDTGELPSSSSPK
jgi:putative membrane protein